MKNGTVHMLVWIFLFLSFWTFTAKLSCSFKKIMHIFKTCLLVFCIVLLWEENMINSDNNQQSPWGDNLFSQSLALVRSVCKLIKLKNKVKLSLIDLCYLLVVCVSQNSDIHNPGQEQMILIISPVAIKFSRKH